jgi:hypothetical protein
MLPQAGHVLRNGPFQCRSGGKTLKRQYSGGRPSNEAENDTEESEGTSEIDQENERGDDRSRGENDDKLGCCRTKLDPLSRGSAAKASHSSPLCWHSCSKSSTGMRKCSRHWGRAIFSVEHKCSPNPSHQFNLVERHIHSSTCINRQAKLPRPQGVCMKEKLPKSPWTVRLAPA